MRDRKSPITFESIRLLGLGRLTSCAQSTKAKPGILLGGSKGLFHLSEPGGKPRRLRRHPVGYILTGETGLICYEEVSGRGRIAILDAQLQLVREDTELARRVNPLRYWNDGLIILHRAEFQYLDLRTGERRSLASFVPTRTLSPLVPASGGYEFLAVHRGEKWPTYLHRLEPSLEPGGKTALKTLAQAEDPLTTRHFLVLQTGDYMMVPQGRAVFQILRVYPEETAVIRTLALVPIAGEAHPVGMLLWAGKLLLASGDSILSFSISEEPGKRP